MNLVVDVGNTRTKYAFFDGEHLVSSGYDTEGMLTEISCLKQRGETVDLFLSGSGRPDESMKLQIIRMADSFLEADPLMPVPLSVGYATPETLGFDRIAICVGAHTLFPDSSLLVIDSGTALTFNYVSREGVFLGGNISPGLEMRFRSLHDFTARLPYVQPLLQYGEMGRTTPDAIRSGVMNGMLFEVQEYIRQFESGYPNPKVVITGGNSAFLENRLEGDVAFNNILGFVGLNAIFRFVKKV